MGSRLHYAQHYNPEFKGGFFNRDHAAWEKLFMDKFAENGFNDEQNEYEVERTDLQAYVDELKLLPDQHKNEYFTDYTNEMIIQQLEEVLTSDDDTIHIEWF